MPDKIFSHALTTVERVKDKLGITNTNADIMLLRMINGVTDFIEGQCNRRFLTATYTDELYSVYGERQTHLLLKQAPVTALTGIKYRQGAIGSPTWGNYTTNDYELVGDGKSGLVKFYTYLGQGMIPGNNTLKVTYTAGYKIDFENFGDLTKHTLPADLSELAERLVIKSYQKRLHPGKSTETFNGSSVTWSDAMDKQDEAVLALYRRMGPFV